MRDSLHMLLRQAMGPVVVSSPGAHAPTQALLHSPPFVAPTVHTAWTKARVHAWDVTAAPPDKVAWSPTKAAAQHSTGCCAVKQRAHLSQCSPHLPVSGLQVKPGPHLQPVLPQGPPSASGAAGQTSAYAQPQVEWCCVCMQAPSQQHLCPCQQLAESQTTWARQVSASSLHVPLAQPREAAHGQSLLQAPPISTGVDGHAAGQPTQHNINPVNRCARCVVAPSRQLECKGLGNELTAGAGRCTDTASCAAGTGAAIAAVSAFCGWHRRARYHCISDIHW